MAQLKGKIIIELNEREGTKQPNFDIYSDLEIYEIIGILELAKNFVINKKHKKL